MIELGVKPKLSKIHRDKKVKEIIKKTEKG